MPCLTQSGECYLVVDYCHAYMVSVMFLNVLSGLSGDHPAASAARRRVGTALHGCPLPDSADVTTEMTHANMSVSTDEGYVPAVTVAVYGTPRPGRADRAGALALTILNAKGTCGSGTAGAASM